MNHRKLSSVSYPRAFFMLILIVFLTACASPAAYREPITRFQQASTIVIEGARTTYGTANKGERNAEIDKHVEQKKRITLRDLNSEDLRLLGPDDVVARMKTLDALAKHSELLLALASSDAPQKAKDAANSLDEAIISLNSALGNASTDDFKNTAGGFAAIAGEVVQLVLNAKITEALDKAIVVSEDQVKLLLRLLRTEMGALYERKRAQISNERVAAVDAYNDLVAQPNPNSANLAKVAEQIKSVEDSWDNLPQLLGAGPGLDAMAQAHQKLVDYAKSPKNPQDFAALVEAVDAFVTRAKIIADAIKSIQATQR
uniref:Uncharacterized protein n=1 Tax=Candidatus Kentrum sp. UNK TaxID=2126344 RepID=A0A451AFG5_9GAMM|nr:MAG: hypothetical protein BECKUNK1418G_GA0071005_105016 [Candidatus Kentron sp. UNK]VFK71227.1 MAG: hypothetical protein BECKUNK1418H_GA0071006_105515 [Candidatus Kentron sp. UNK]